MYPFGSRRASPSPACADHLLWRSLWRSSTRCWTGGHRPELPHFAHTPTEFKLLLEQEVLLCKIVGADPLSRQVLLKAQQVHPSYRCGFQPHVSVVRTHAL